MINKEVPPIDVCLPVLNGEKYIKDSINSVLNQDYQKFNLIIMLNKSTDNSKKICKKFEKKHKKVKLFYQQKKVSIDKNWYDCIKKAKSKNIIIIGHDDIWANKQYLNNLSKSLKIDCIPFGVVQMFGRKKLNFLSNKKNFSFDNKINFINRILFSLHPSILGKNNYIYGLHNRNFIIKIFKKFINEKKSIIIDGDNYFNYEILKFKKFIRVKNSIVKKRLSTQELSKRNILEIISYQFFYFFKFFKYSNFFEVIILLILIPFGIAINIIFLILNRLINYKNN